MVQFSLHPYSEIAFEQESRKLLFDQRYRIAMRALDGYQGTGIQYRLIPLSCAAVSPSAPPIPFPRRAR